MKYINEAEVHARLDEILDEAQRQPIVIRRADQELAAVVSVALYDRLRALDTESFLACEVRLPKKLRPLDSRQSN
jgi:hypothetical protein